MRVHNVGIRLKCVDCVSIVQLQPKFVRRMLEEKILSGHEYLLLLKAVPNCQHAHGWTVLLDRAVSYK